MTHSPRDTPPPPASPDIGSPAPAKARFWDRLARRYAAAPIADMPGYDRTLQRTQQWLRPHHHVLEIGCGTGTSALRLAPGVARYVATDVSGQMIAIARQKLAGQPCEQLRFETADADAIAHERGSCDAVIAFNVLHLVTDLDGAMEACAEALRPGGCSSRKHPACRK